MGNIQQIYNEIQKVNEENNILGDEIHTLNILIANINEHNAILKEELQVKILEIEFAHEEIKQSINFGQKIQEALLPNISILRNVFPNSFIYYKSKDIVSGDFYWFTSIGEKFLIAAVDCTGHGVPGAFMSMLGIVLLNDIIKNNNINDAAKVLDELRSQVKKSLQQSGKTDELQDGMDIVFCIIDNNTLEMSFAGAFNPLWMVKSSDTKLKNNELHNKNESIITIYETDEQPVGVYPLEKAFTEKRIQLEKNDLLYLFTDGYISQLNPDKNKSFRSDRLKKLLSDIHCLPLEEQKQILEKNFDDWKGYNNQTDDILIIGIRI
jgi:serine phosphatase RsbU (regulator of sigma subunit)